MTSSSSLYGSVNTQNASSTNSTSLYGEAGTPIPTPTGDLVVRGDLIVLSGNILTTSGTGNIFPTNATTINLGNSATTINIGAATGTTTINNDLLVDGNLTVNGIFTAPDAQFGNITIAVATDNTITTTTGNLVLESASGEIDTGNTTILSTNSSTFLLLNSPTTVNAFQGATALTMGAATGSTTIRNDLVVQGNITGDGGDLGNITIAVADDQTITTTAGDLVLGSFNNLIKLAGVSTVYTDNTSTFNLLNQPTTINAFTSATTLNIGSNTGTTNINNDLLLDGDTITLAPATFINYSEANDRLNRPTVQSTTGNTSGWRVNAPNATTSAVSNISAASSNDNANNKFIGIQARGAATNDLRIQTGKYTAGVQGASGTVVTFIDYLTPYATVNPAGPTNSLDLTTKAYVDGLPDINTTYTVDASTTTGGANLNLVGSDASTDTIKFAAGTNVTVTATDANTITITSVLGPGTTYDFAASSATGGANLNLAGSDLTTDTVKLTNAGHITATYTSATEVTLGSDATDANTVSTIVARDASGNFSAGTVSLAGQLIDTQANNTADGGGQIFLNGANGNRIDWAAAGTGAPAFTTRTTGTKAVLYPSLSGSTTDYALGIDAATMWSSIPENNDSFKFKWYGATTQVASLSGTGNLVLVGDATIKDTLTIEGATSGSVALTAPAVAGTQAYTLPTALPGVSGYVLAADTSGVMSWVANPDTNTTYTIDATSTTGGANLNLAGSDASTDSVAYLGSGGTTVARTDANTITISSASMAAPTNGSLLAGNGTTWTNSILGVSSQYNLNRNTTGGTGGNQILSLIKTRTDGTRTNGQGPSQVFNYAGTDGGYNFARIASGYQSGGVHTMSFALSTDVTGNFGAGTSTPLTLSSTSTTITASSAITLNGDTITLKNSAGTTNYINATATGTSITGAGLSTVTRTTVGTPGVAENRPSMNIQLTRSDQAVPNDNDGTSFRARVAGSSGVAYTIADIASTYDTGGDVAFNVNLANGDQTTGAFSSLNTFASTITRTVIKAGTASATPGASTGSDVAVFTPTNNTFSADALTLLTYAGVPLPSGKITYGRQYINAYSTVDQTNPVAGAENLMIFGTTDINNGITIVTNGTALTRITFANAGLYNLQFSAQLSQTSGGSTNSFIWLKKNGTAVANTAGDTRVAGNGDKIMAAWNYVFSAAAGDYYELAWSAGDTSVILDYLAAAAPVPAIPSVILTVTPVGA